MKLYSLDPISKKSLQINQLMESIEEMITINNSIWSLIYIYIYASEIATGLEVSNDECNEA